MKKALGFTLIELMMTVAVIGILSAVAYPSYLAYVLRANRSAAESEMMEIANRQQQFLIANRRYAASLGELNFTLSNEVEGPYDCAINVPAAAVPQFTITCTGTGAQAADNDLGPLTLDQSGNKSPAEKWRR